MTKQMLENARQAGNELISKLCICKTYKRPGTPLCQGCWKKLTLLERTRLRRMLKDSYVAAYLEIRKRLTSTPQPIVSSLDHTDPAEVQL